MASGDYPDYVQLPKALYFRYAQEGALIELMTCLTKQIIPINGIDDVMNFSRVDGIYGIPFVRFAQPHIFLTREKTA